MSIILEDVFSQTSPDPAVPYGVGIVSYGLTAWDAVSGYGLLSRGLLWQLYQIWFDSQYYEPISTSWTDNNSAVTTNWTDDNASVSTTWADEYAFNGF